MVSNFEDSNNIGKIGEEVVLRTLQHDKKVTQIVDVSGLPSMQRKDIDIIIVKNKREITLEVKTTRTKNDVLFYELWSCYEYRKKGANVITEADKLVYYMTRSNKLYILETIYLNDWVKANINWLKTKYEKRYTTEAVSGIYTTIGINIPCWLLKKHELVKEIDLTRFPDVLDGIDIPYKY